MSQDALSDLAEAAGLILDWEDTQSVPQRVAPDAVRAILTALGYACDTEAACRESLSRLKAAPAPDFLAVDVGQPILIAAADGAGKLRLESGEVRDVRIKGGVLPAIAEPGYHSLELADRQLTLAVCPDRCVTPTDLLERRSWGLTTQIYSLAGPGGFGDFGDLAAFAAKAGQAGADALAISPVHALFAADPNHYSPYSPSSRDWLNGLFADPAVLGVTRTAQPPADLIDWPEASPAKLTELRALVGAANQDARYRSFVQNGGEDLRRHALFEALHGHFRRTQQIHDWRAWPAPFQDTHAAEAAAAELGLNDEIAFHLTLQWLADLSLGQAHAAARAAGMGIGLITDLAVGLDPAGAHAWSRREDLLTGLTLGAPPDAFQANGQGWGITSFAPDALIRGGFAPFLKTLRSALRHAGGVRIDHALGLKRIWVLPEGASPLEGAYLKYPFEDLLRLIALESQRAQAVVIGEDLGVVPPGLRDMLEGRGLLGMRVLAFERTKDGGFKRPEDYDAGAAAMTSTHDLPPVAGWWAGRDIEWRDRLGDAKDRVADDAERAEHRHLLWQALSEAGAADGPEPPPSETQPVVDAAIAMTAATACELLLVPVEDLLGVEEQVNLPGIVERHPNWRRRLPLAADAFFEEPAVRRRLDSLNTERPR
ncbi:4-alpha-glucanotransferase [Phenylobacterium deserti]|uniref:4-alpha-glucanotransferase n=1 Tax=Phenylobacterium deserti TaxID=1914756 RepID=A0A328AC77_9CAUL|nr:4-alpha-glucanotransferase [Phenylobacterium deserti]RAK52229.1 4-alpha-glucanotransferase [Phenylobacterium deserti]